jgi:phage-related baseplate assembly protein
VTLTYKYYTGLVAEAQLVVDGDPADRVTYPGYRAAGVDVRVLTPDIVTIVVTATLTILDGYDLTTVAASVESNIISYINELGISGDVVRNEVIERIMTTPGVYNVNLVAPALDIIVDDDEIPRTSTVEVTVS